MIKDLFKKKQPPTPTPEPLIEMTEAEFRAAVNEALFTLRRTLELHTKKTIKTELLYKHFDRGGAQVFLNIGSKYMGELLRAFILTPNLEMGSHYNKFSLIYLLQRKHDTHWFAKFQKDLINKNSLM
jgi:hypothetical protein